MLMKKIEYTEKTTQAEAEAYLQDKYGDKIVPDAQMPGNPEIVQLPNGKWAARVWVDEPDA